MEEKGTEFAILTSRGVRSEAGEGSIGRGGAGESGGDGGAFDDSGGESQVEGDSVGQAQGQAVHPEQDTAAERLLHEVQRQALDSARQRGEPASAPAPGWAHSA